MDRLTITVPVRRVTHLPAGLAHANDMVSAQGSGGSVQLCSDLHGARFVLKRPFVNAEDEALLHVAAAEAAFASTQRGVISCALVHSGAAQLLLLVPFRELGDVQQFAERNGVASEERARGVMFDVLHGLVACHSARIAHLDVKPENVLLFGDAGAEMCDFGAAERLPDSPDAMFMGRPRGTSRAMSPDAFLNNAEAAGLGFDARAADVWGAGVVLYTLLTGCAFLSHVADAELSTVMQELTRSGSVFPAQVTSRAINKARGRRVGPAPAAAVALLQALLTIDPVLRPTACDALRQPWLRPCSVF